MLQKPADVRFLTLIQIKKTIIINPDLFLNFALKMSKKGRAFLFQVNPWPFFQHVFWVLSLFFSYSWKRYIKDLNTSPKQTRGRSFKRKNTFGTIVNNGKEKLSSPNEHTELNLLRFIKLPQLIHYGWINAHRGH